MPIKVEVPKLEGISNKAFQDSVIELLLFIEERAKKTASVDLGFYRNNIVANIEEGKVEARVEYSKAVEYGFKPGFKTKTFSYIFGRTPNPVMRNAARVANLKKGAIFVKNFNKQLRK